VAEYFAKTIGAGQKQRERLGLSFWLLLAQMGTTQIERFLPILAGWRAGSMSWRGVSVVRQSQQQRLTAERKAAGVCIICKERPERFKLYCSRCLKSRAEQSQRYHAKHKKRIAARKKARYEYNKKHGLCTNCGNKLERDMEPGVRCVNCLGMNKTCRRLNGR